MFWYGNDGIFVDSYPLPDKVAAALIRELWINDGNVGITTIENAAYQLSGNQFISVKCPVAISEGITTIVSKGALRWKLDGTNKGIDYIGTDREGNLYVHEQEYVPDVKVLVLEDSIVKYDREGKKTEYSIYDISDCLVYPLNSITVTESGEVYVMKCKENQVEVYQVLLGTDDESHMQELTERAMKEEAALLAVESGIGQAEIQSTNPNTSLKRSEVLSRAQAMAELSWTVSAANKTVRENTALPSYVQNASIGATLKGIPYCWGGFNGLDTVSSEAFSAAVKGKVMAGNVKIDSPGHISGTVGLDCSGFVSSAYGLTGRMSTGKFDKFGYLIDSGQLRTMDFLVKATGSPAHVVLFYAVDGSNYVIFDSSLEMGKVAFRKVAKNNYTASKGYSARTPWLVDCVPVGGYLFNNLAHWKLCSDCGDRAVSTVAPHTWVAMGSQFQCSVCGKTSNTATSPTSLRLIDDK